MKPKTNSCRIYPNAMRPLLLFVSLTTLPLLLSCGNAAAPVSISSQPVSINGVRQKGVPPKPLPLMSWTSQDGQKQKVDDFRGRVLILDFWATYCEPCRREIPHLNELQARYGAADLQIVGLHSGGDEDRPKIPAFVTDTKMDYPVGFPEDALVSYVFEENDAIPQTVVIDREGRLVTKIIGFDDQIRRQLDAAVESAISRR
ncbi:MAG: TlpA family protein disulfide reductase [Pyrinomonadaceae bacterium]